MPPKPHGPRAGYGPLSPCAALLSAWRSCWRWGPWRCGSSRTGGRDAGCHVGKLVAQNTEGTLPRKERQHRRPTAKARTLLHARSGLWSLFRLAGHRPGLLQQVALPSGRTQVSWVRSVCRARQAALTLARRAGPGGPCHQFLTRTDRGMQEGDICDAASWLVLPAPY